MWGQPPSAVRRAQLDSSATIARELRLTILTLYVPPDRHADGILLLGAYFVRFSFQGLLSTGVPRNLSAAASSPMTDISNALCPVPLNAKAFSRS